MPLECMEVRMILIARLYDPSQPDTKGVGFFLCNIMVLLMITIMHLIIT